MSRASTRDMLAKFDKDRMSRSLTDAQSKYVKPHIESGYKFTTPYVIKHSDKYWKERAGKQSRNIKCSADSIMKVKLGRKNPGRCVCGKMQTECYNGSCLLALCKRSAQEARDDRLNKLWYNYGDGAVEETDLPLSEQIRRVAIDEGESVLPAVRRTQFEKLREEKRADKRFSVSEGWLCGVCRALNLAEMKKCGTCGREKGESLEVDEDDYVRRLKERFARRGKYDRTIEEKLEEKKNNREERKSKRNERYEKYLEDEKLKAEDQLEEEEFYDEEAENQRFGSEDESSSDEDVWYMGEMMTKKERGRLEEEKALLAVQPAKTNMLSNFLNEVNPFRHGRIAMYSYMRDELDRRTKIGESMQFVLGTDYTDIIQETDRRKLLDGKLTPKPDPLLEGGPEKKKKKKKQES